jgi:hypothetical protein
MLGSAFQQGRATLSLPLHAPSFTGRLNMRQNCLGVRHAMCLGQKNFFLQCHRDPNPNPHHDHRKCVRAYVRVKYTSEMYTYYTAARQCKSLVFRHVTCFSHSLDLGLEQSRMISTYPYL